MKLISKGGTLCELLKLNLRKLILIRKLKKEFHYYNYYLECDNGKRILIRAVLDDDKARLDMVATYVG